MLFLKQHLQVAFLVAVFSALMGCAQLGLPTPETFNEKVAAGYGTITQIVTTADTLLKAKKISPEDAENVLKSTDVAKVGIDTARKIHATDPTGADGKLNAIRTGLAAISAYLASRGGG